MLRTDSSNIDPDRNKHSSPTEASHGGASGVDIQRELNRLEDMILASSHIPLIRKTLVDEEQLLNQLDLVRLNLPPVFEEAQAIVHQKKEILLQAEQYAQQIIEAAEAKAAQILNEMGIVRQAELEAKQIRQQLQQEYEAAQEQIMAEIEQTRRQAQQELEEMRQRAIFESEEMQNGADEYADSVLQNIEQQLKDMLRITRNGRQQLQPETPPNRNLHPDSAI